jgi:hypothetical protein
VNGETHGFPRFVMGLVTTEPRRGRNLHKIVLTLKSSGADSSVPHAGVPQDCGGNGGSDTRNGMWLCWRREIPPCAKAAKDGPTHGISLCWRCGIPPFAKAAKDGPPTACGCVGGVKSHPLQKRQRMGHPRHIVVLAVWNPTLCKSGKGWATHGVWLCWRREIPPFAKAAKDGAPREKL